VDKGVIDLEAIYSQKQSEVQKVDEKSQEELERRQKEDKQIQEAEMKKNEPAQDKAEKG
jgi:energy-coupling factor transport system substrate-specific component